MLNSSRPARRNLARRSRLALVVPTALLAITAMVSPSFADDVTPDDGGETPAVTETPSPSVEPEPAPKPEQAPAAEPKAEPKAKAEPKPALASTPTPGAAFADAEQVKTTESAVAAAKDDEPDNKKVVVCKYVGTPPGVPHHIIVVSKNAIKNWDGTTFPWTFADAQDSVAIRYAVGNEQPGDEELGNCPLAEEALPEIPVNDPCGLDNAAYGEVPTGNYTIVRNLDGSITLKADAGYEFPGGSDEYVFDAPADENIPCEPTVIDPPTVPQSDPCGPDNIAYGAVPAGDYEVATNDDGSITLTAHEGFVFGDGPTYTFPALTDSGAICTDTENEKKVVVCKYVSTPGGVLDHIIIVSVNTLKDWDGSTFPYPFPDAQDSVAIRFAQDGEQAHDVDVAECPSDEPAEIDAPEVPIEDPCGAGNAVYGAVPEGDYDVALNEDGSITLTAHEGSTFPGEESTYTYPVPEESNIEPCVIDAPEVPIDDPCDPDNATYGEVPLSENYSIAYNEDGSITLTAVDGTTFPGDEPTYTYPVLVDENTEPCPVVDDTRVVLCSYTTTEVARTSLLGTIEILPLADLVAKGFLGLFPFEFIEGDTTSTAVRYATEGEVAEDIEGITCGVGGEIEEEDPETPGDVDGVEEAGLPNTGGPAGWLVPFGTGLILAGAGLVLARRREIV